MNYMAYKREWSNRLNTAGFAAECARLALPFYKGDRKSDLVAAIETAERYAGGEEISYSASVSAADNARYAAYNAHEYIDDVDAADIAFLAAQATSAASNTVAYAVNTVDCIDYRAITASATAAHYAARAGADAHEIRAAFARWVVRDLSGERELPEGLRCAAGAAIVAGDEDLAKELLQ